MPTVAVTSSIGSGGTAVRTRSRKLRRKRSANPLAAVESAEARIDDELVAAVAAHGIGSSRVLAERLGHQPQHPIAGQMVVACR